MSFIEKLNAVVEELKANPEIYVAHYEVLPPDVSAISEVEEKLGYSLDKSITDFYKECGGVQLVWINKNNDNFENKKAEIEAFEKPLDEFIYFGDQMPPDGSIMIASIKTVFLKKPEIDVCEDEFEDYEMLAESEDLEIHVFDMFGYSADVAFITNKTANPPMLLGIDYQACYTDSLVIYFDEYLELLLKVKGARSRSKFMESEFLEDDFDEIEDQVITSSDIARMDASLYINHIM